MRRVAFELASRRGLPLRGDVYPAATPGDDHPVVVVCHGFKGFKNWGFFPYLGERLAGAGLHAVLFNFSGSGIGPDLENFTELDRFAEDTISKQLEDVGTVIDAVVAGTLPVPGAAPRHVGLLGHSRGGADAILTAAEDARVRAVVTWASVSTLLRWSEREQRAWRERGAMEFLNTRTRQTMRMNVTALEDLEANRERFDLLRAVASLQVPLLLVHGEEDLSVPVAEARALYAAANPARTRLEIVPRTGHTFGAVHPWQGTTPALERAIEVSIDTFAKHLGNPSDGSAPA